jgi:hypothetical protein
MYVIYNQSKGFLCENEDTIGDDFDYELDEYTVTFSDLESAKKNCEKGEIVLKVEFGSFIQLHDSNVQRS